MTQTEILHTDYRNLGFSDQLASVFATLGCKNLNELLLYKISALYSVSGFDQKCSIELLEFLRKNAMEHLLRD